MFLRIFLLGFVTLGVSFAQQPPAENHEHGAPVQHDGFMQHGMHHAVAKGVLLDVKTDSTAHTFTLRVGPMHLPANTPHMKMPQPADLVWTLPVSGWLLAYHPKLVDEKGAAVEGTVLHHVAFWNENRPDFLCPNKEEHIFGAGSELTDWRQIPGYGYRVEKGDRIRVETMIHNPTATAYDQAYLEITIPYLADATPAPVKNFYPAWIDVQSCGSSGYDLPAGASKKVGTVAVKYSGVLLGVGGHMHDYAQQLMLEKSGSKDPVAVLPATVDAQGHLLSMPVITFFQTGGYALGEGDTLTVAATYQNTSGRLLRQGAMGIVVGYFVPQDDRPVAALRHAPKESAHDMAGISHDH